jgi:hypothetical protein
LALVPNAVKLLFNLIPIQVTPATSQSQNFLYGMRRNSCICLGFFSEVLDNFMVIFTAENANQWLVSLRCEMWNLIKPLAGKTLWLCLPGRISASSTKINIRDPTYSNSKSSNPERISFFASWYTSFLSPSLRIPSAITRTVTFSPSTL